MNEPMLRLRDIHKTFEQRGAPVYVLRGVNFHVDQGEIVALVGESGSGKSTLARIIMQLYAPERGEIDFEGRDVTRARGRLLRQYRSAVQMVFQDPYASLNPTHAVRTILKRSLPPHLRRASRRAKGDIFARVLEQVGLTPPDTFLGLYPHQLSGGQRQRVAFARALEFQPRLVVADEPVSMLDVSLRLGILNLMLDLNERFDIAYLYITHDLASARYIASRIAVMYAGEIVEEGDAMEVIEHPKHPYTRILVSAAPDPERTGDPGATAAVFTGEPPDLSVRIVGCPFQFRCPHVHEACRTLPVPTVTVAAGWHVKCHLYAEGATPTSSSGLSRSLGMARPAGSASSGAAPRASG